MTDEKSLCDRGGKTECGGIYYRVSIVVSIVVKVVVVVIVIYPHRSGSYYGSAFSLFLLLANEA